MTDREQSPPTAAPPWADTYRRHATDLVRLATVLVGHADATDLVADAVSRAIHSPAWQSVRDPGAFLARAVINEATDRHRSEERRRLREQRNARLELAKPFDPTELVDVRRALASLSPQQRAVVFLAYWEDLSIPAIARRLDVGEGTVRRQLDRAKTRLREVLR